MLMRLKTLQLRFAPYPGSSMSYGTLVQSNKSQVKPYSCIPTKRSLIPSSIQLLLNGGPGQLHAHCDRRHSELGPIYREYLGPAELVFISDTKMIQKVMANEGQYPAHNVPPAWTLYNKVHNVERGLFFQSGESWAKLRKAFNKVMLDGRKSSSIYQLSDDILKINQDLIENWRTNFKLDSSTDLLIEDVKDKLCSWSIETTGFLLFGCRMGCIPERADLPADSKADELVKNVSNMFTETSKFQVLPVDLAYKLNLEPWRRFEIASSNMLKIAGEFAAENIAKLKSNNDRISIIQDLLKLGILNDIEVSRSVIDLLIAAADTTSNSLQWMLYLIAKYPGVQSILVRELRNCSIENIPSNEYLRAFIKEAFRLYPTAPFLARTLDVDITLGGYTIPAGRTIVFSLFTTSRLEKYFETPLAFRPERWLRSRQDSEERCQRKNHAYASLPFGIGSRMCIGRRAAELEICLLIFSLLKHYRFLLVGEKEVDIALKMILCPNKPIDLILEPR